MGVAKSAEKVRLTNELVAVALIVENLECQGTDDETFVSIRDINLLMGQLFDTPRGRVDRLLTSLVRSGVLLCTERKRPFQVSGRWVARLERTFNMAPEFSRMSGPNVLRLVEECKNLKQSSQKS